MNAISLPNVDLVFIVVMIYYVFNVVKRPQQLICLVKNLGSVNLYQFCRLKRKSVKTEIGTDVLESR